MYNPTAANQTVKQLLLPINLQRVCKVISKQLEVSCCIQKIFRSGNHLTQMPVFSKIQTNLFQVTDYVLKMSIELVLVSMLTGKVQKERLFSPNSHGF